MAGGFDGRPGGIVSLGREIRDHGEAIEYELIALGLRLEWLGTEALTWRDLWVIVKNAAPDGAIAISRMGEAARWNSVMARLVMHGVNLLAHANWQRQGKPSAPKPRPVTPPGSDETRRIGSEPLPLNELDEWIAKAERGDT